MTHLDSSDFRVGIDRLCGRMPQMLASHKLGLLAHPASMSCEGIHSSVLLHTAYAGDLVALFGPEHGFFGLGAAGEDMSDARHSAWNIPIYSLYGDLRRPSKQMIEALDLFVFDLQDIGVRCYTFVSTLRYIMEECAKLGKPLIVCDRPIPQPNTVDGPGLDNRFESFVSALSVPLVYGMTPGEVAQFIKQHYQLNIDLTVVGMSGYRRESRRNTAWGEWISPSPGIRHWETAWYYPATVFFEALPAIDYGRGGLEPFRVITAPFIDAEQLAVHLNALKLAGISFQPHWTRNPGVRLSCTDPDSFLPVTTGLHIIRVLQDLYGLERIWNHPGTRPDFFDKLAGGDATRLALQGSGNEFQDLIKCRPCAEFMAERARALLY